MIDLKIPEGASFRWFTDAENREFFRERRQVVPSAQRSPVWATWHCLPALGYCGCPAGHRCHCGKGYEDHDRGDEG